MLPVSISIKVDTELAKVGSNFLLSVAGKGKELIGSIVSTYAPQLQLWAATNIMKCYDRFEDENKRRAAAGRRSIPMRIALPALKQIAEQDDDSLLLMWARLLANLQDGDRDDLAERFLIDILGSFEPSDAAVLKIIADTERDDPQRPYIVLAVEELVSHVALDRTRLLVSLHNLTRLGCLIAIAVDHSPVAEKNPFYRPLHFGAGYYGAIEDNLTEAIGELAQSQNQIALGDRFYGAGPIIIKSETVMFRLTALGVRLVDACRSADEPRTSDAYQVPPPQDGSEPPAGNASE